MNFSATKTLTDTVGKYIPIEKLNIASDVRRNYRGTEYIADFVEIFTEKQNGLSFEVTENEIIIFFFTDHVHFEDYSIDLEEGEPEYIQRACEFLDKLFTLPIELRYTLKGWKIIKSESFFILQNEKESCAGKTFMSAGLKNIFKPKTQCIETKKFNRSLEIFENIVCQGMLFNEIVEKMYDKSLDSFADKVLKVVYSKDKSMRYVILQNESGLVHFVFEKIELYDEYELNFSGNGLPAYWNGTNYSVSFFATLEDALKNLKFEAEYKQNFLT